MQHRVVFDFRVTRRIGWDLNGLHSLGDHLDAVRRAAEASPIASRVDVVADLEMATMELSMWVEAPTAADAEALATLEVGEAIRNAGATHVGLLSSAEEARVAARQQRWAGLRTPAWHPRRLATVKSA
jgi:hypothetical protein